MPDAEHGKALFAGLEDYPLPERTGVRDYFFDFVPDPGYGASARVFFERHYPHHHHHPVTSLEQLVGVLASDLTSGGVQRVREVAIVCHGSAIGLKLPLVATPVDDNQRVLTAYSMALLQKQLKDGGLPSLAQHRSVVVQHLDERSWVTVRACNFGQSRQGLYALYSFFGGKADAYAPTEYQFFGWQPIAAGARYPNRLRVHEHLVRQRFLPKDRHTPDRQDAVVRALVDPASFSEPFVLASKPRDVPEPPEYSAVVDALNQSRVTPTITSRFHDAGFDLVEPRVATVVSSEHEVLTDAAWTIRDSIRHPGNQGDQVRYPVLYHVGRGIATGSSTEEVTAEAQLVAVTSAHEKFYLQLFLAEREHDEFVGRLFALAVTKADDAADSSHKQRFDAVLAILLANPPAGGTTVSAGPVDLRALFTDAGHPLGADPHVAQVSPTTTPPDTSKAVVWRVGPGSDGASQFLVKLEHEFSSAGIPGSVLNVYSDLDAAARTVEQMRLLSGIGADPDSPGVELAAFLDRLTIDDLADVITHLRTPYLPGHALFIDHAQQAIRRKGEYLTWITTRYPDPSSMPWPDNDPLTALSLGEAEDRRAAVYDFTFDSHWAEAKASNRTPFAMQHDLLLEEPLAKRFGITDLGQRDAVTIEEDSPSVDEEALRRLETQGFERFFATTGTKSMLPDDIPSDVGCSDFRAAVFKFRDLSGGPVDAMAAALSGQKTADGGTDYLKIVLDLKSKYSLLRNLTKLTELNEFVKLPKIPVPTDAYEWSKLIGKHLARSMGWEVVAGVLEKVGEWDFVITIPVKMWLHIIEEQQQGADRAVVAGRLTALRRYLRFLNERTFEQHPDLSSDMQIDVTVSRTGRPYWLEAYDEEMSGPFGRGETRFILFDEEFHRGFDAGTVFLPFLGHDMLRIANDIMGQAMQDTGLSSCQLQALVDAGMLDWDQVKALAVRAVTYRMLDLVPHV